MSYIARPIHRTPSVLLAALLGAVAAALVACGDATAPDAHAVDVPPADSAPVPRAAVVARVELDAPALALDEGSTHRLVATPRDAAGQPLDRVVAWASSDPLVATVSERGVVSALRAGTATVTATAEGTSAALRLTVRAAYAYDLLFDAPTGAVLQLPQIWRLDLRAADESSTLVGAGFDGASDMALSPDGRRTAFVAHNGGNSDIMVMNRDGSGLRVVTSTSDNDDEPAWSPDGRTIAFVRTGGERMGDLWLVDADGGNARALMREEEPPFDQRSPAWSPDGALLAYASHHEIIGNRAGDWQLYTVRADGTGVVRRTSTGYDKRNPAWIAR